MSIFDNIASAEWVLNAAIQTFLILGIGLLLAYQARHKAAPFRSGICLITMLALILLPFLSVSLNVLHYVPLQTVLPITIGQSPGPSVSVTHNLVEMPLPDGNEENSENSRRVQTGPAAVKILNIFGIVWGFGLLFMLIRLALGAIAIRTLKKGLVEASDARISSIIQSAAAVFSTQLDARVYLSQRAPYPMAVGILKPVILIPEHLLHTLQDGQIRGILLHELSHIHHRDLLTGILQRFVTALNWWNPLAYALSTAYSRAREEISDNHVLLQNDSKEYAECLINLAEKTTLWKRLSVSVGLASPHIPLKDRVKHILSKERIMDTNLKKSTIAVMVVTAFLFLLGIAGSRMIFATGKAESTIENVDFLLPGPQEQGPKEQDQEKDKSAKKDIKPPKLIKKVDPVYPQEAHDAGIEGTVTLEATTNIRGRVQKVKVLNSVPGLDQAAIDAIKQWVYEPMVINGKPIGIIFTTPCRFSLKEGKLGTSYEGGVTGTGNKPAVRAIGDIKPPKLIKMVKPFYPEDARKAGIEGVVILEATTDIYGRVINTTVLRSIPELDQVAMAAVKQWVFEPMIVDGEPRGVIFTVTCNFQPDELDEPEQDIEDTTQPRMILKKKPVKAVGDIISPKVIKKVKPVYPESAREAGIEGVVILEATTDEYGRVVDTKILRSIPELDQAAIDAVKQWVFEPMIIDGEPRSVVFTVTVKFEKD